MKKKTIAAIVATACAAVMAVSLVGCGGSSSSSSSNSSSTSSSGTNLRFVTGGESGTYYAFGTVLANYATNNAGVSITALTGNGSQANVQALQDGDAELAFCQSDVLSYAYNGERLFEGAAYQDFSIVAALYNETVQIVTCNPDIKSVEDLKGKTVSVGATGSGTYFNAVDVLEAYGLNVDSDITAVYQDFGDSTDSLKDNKIDAAFVVAGAPTTSITDLSTSKTAYLVSMDDEHVKALEKSSPYYTGTTIPADTYTGVGETKTVSVQAVIIANDSVSEDNVYNFVKSIFDGAEKNASAHDKYSEIAEEYAASITTVPYHPGAAKYFDEIGIEVATK